MLTKLKQNNDSNEMKRLF